MSSRKLECDLHGRGPWQGEVICTACGAVWKLEGDTHVPPPELGTHCTCGANLVGPEGTARAICTRCYEAMHAREARA